MIPEKIIEDIRDRTDIVQVISSVLDLKKSGRNYKALCPFHGEKTPSFMVSPEKQIYHCFGCGRGGNAFHFLMEYEGVGFIEAVRRLGQDLGVDIDRYTVRGKDRGKLDPYYRAVEYAASYYIKMLGEHGGASNARRYIEERGLGGEPAELFRIGFAPPGWDHFYRAAMESGISRDILLKLNLVMKSRGGSGYRDYFRNRVIFPITNISNRVVGLAGRVLDDSEPKYLNTTDSPIYSKGRILYGLNHSKDYIRKDATAVIVEGYTDYLTLWIKGIRNHCAVCGTALTEDQAHLLARYAKRVYIINDGDRAGIRASVRAADQLLIEGFETQIVILPEGEDPDSLVRKRGADVLRDMMRSAPNYLQYLKGEAERGNRTTYKKNQVVKHLLETLSRSGDDIRKELYLQEISKLFEIPVGTLRANLKDRRRKRPSEKSGKPVAGERERFQKQLFRIGLEQEQYSRMILNNIFEEDLEGAIFRDYYKALDLAFKNHIDITSPDFIGAIEDPELCKLASEIALMQMPPGPVEQLLPDMVIWLKRAALRDEMRLLKKRINELQAEHGAGDSPEEVEIAEAYRKIARELKKLVVKEGIQTDGSP